MTYRKDAVILGAAFVALIDKGFEVEETLHAILDKMPWTDDYKAHVFAYLIETPHWQWSVEIIEKILEKADG